MQRITLTKHNSQPRWAKYTIGDNAIDAQDTVADYILPDSCSVIELPNNGVLEIYDRHAGKCVHLEADKATGEPALRWSWRSNDRELLKKLPIKENCSNAD